MDDGLQGKKEDNEDTANTETDGGTAIPVSRVAALSAFISGTVLLRVLFASAHKHHVTWNTHRGSITSYGKRQHYMALSCNDVRSLLWPIVLRVQIVAVA